MLRRRVALDKLALVALGVISVAGLVVMVLWAVFPQH
jgi:hypothetical protein